MVYNRAHLLILKDFFFPFGKTFLTSYYGKFETQKWRKFLNFI